MTFSTEFGLMIIATVVLVVITVVLVQRERRSARRQKIHADQVIAELYRYEMQHYPVEVSTNATSHEDGSPRLGLAPMAMTVAANSTGSALPHQIVVVVTLGLLLGIWAVATRRTLLGLMLIIVALLIAGSTAVVQEGTSTLRSGMKDSRSGSGHPPEK